MTAADERTPRRGGVGGSLELGALALLAGFTVVSVLGYWIFALHPERLPQSETALRFYAISFGFFAQLHILIAFTALATMLVVRSGLRWLPALVAVYVLSFLAEHIGTGTGVPFGAYSYTGLLGVRIGPRVPALIPLSWFLMGVPSWVLARAAFPDHPWVRTAVGALGLVIWDLALDPAISDLSAYWRWEGTGPYYGMPWSNMVGWFVTGLVLMIALERTAGAASLHTRLSVRRVAGFYLLVVSLPLGMLAASESWLGVVVTVTALTIVGSAVAYASATLRTQSPAPSPARA